MFVEFSSWKSVLGLSVATYVVWTVLQTPADSPIVPVPTSGVPLPSPLSAGTGAESDATPVLASSLVTSPLVLETASRGAYSVRDLHDAAVAGVEAASKHFKQQVSVDQLREMLVGSVVDPHDTVKVQAALEDLLVDRVLTELAKVCDPYLRCTRPVI